MAKKRAKPVEVKVSRWIAKDRRGPTAGIICVFAGSEPKLKGDLFGPLEPGKWFGISNEECEAHYGFIPRPGECFRVDATVTKVK